MCYAHGMCYAACVLTTTHLGVVTMYYNKNNLKETIVIEVAVLAFWVFLFIVGYLFAHATF